MFLYTIDLCEYSRVVSISESTVGWGCARNIVANLAAKSYWGMTSLFSFASESSYLGFDSPSSRLEAHTVGMCAKRSRRRSERGIPH